MNLSDAVTCLWLTKAHWANFHVLEGDKQALQAGAWLDVLGDVEIAEVRQALAELDVAGQDFAPTPGQVRIAILTRRGDVAPDLDQALTEVLTSINRHGSMCPDRPALSHPAVEAAVKAMGGWRSIGMAEMSEPWRAQFRQTYEAAAQRTDRETAMPPVMKRAALSVAATLQLPAGPVAVAEGA